MFSKTENYWNLIEEIDKRLNTLHCRNVVRDHQDKTKTNEKTEYK